MPIRNAEEEILFHIGPGTPSGEVFRRYWLPIELSNNLGSGTGLNRCQQPDQAQDPRRAPCALPRRQRQAWPRGRALQPPGTSLYYGRIEEEGLRCLYHGWMYDRRGIASRPPPSPRTATSS